MHFFNNSSMMQQTTECKESCGSLVYFLDSVVSEFDGVTQKPLEVETGEVHDCQERGWSPIVSCSRCHGKIRFHNDIRAESGKKIPHGIDLKPHMCVGSLR